MRIVELPAEVVPCSANQQALLHATAMNVCRQAAGGG
jgi:hypothetical protein